VNTLGEIVMRTSIVNFILAAVLLQGRSPAAALQDHGWDCPGTGYLPFRHELLLSTGQVAELIEAGEATIIHVGFDESAGSTRQRARYADGHLPGALHLKWSLLQGSLLSDRSRSAAFESLGLLPGRRIVLYDTGLGFEAAAAYAALDALGLEDRAALLDGQWVKWASEGRPLCRWTSEAEASPLETRRGERGITPAEVASLFLRTDVSFLDARPGPAPTRRPFTRMTATEQLVSLQRPEWKSEAELRRLWSALPPRPERRLVVAGRHWTQAAPVYFAAKLLGYSVQLMDGSIEDLGVPDETLERGT
jgi:3-mercaptopyruvate sulfurtransferase SseA